MAADVIVRFLADTKGIQQATSEVQGTGPKLASWAKGVGAAIGVAFAFDTLKDSVNLASDLADQVDATGVVFGKASKEVVAWSEHTSTSMGLAQADALKAALQFGTLGKAAGLAGKDLAAFTTDLAARAGDVASLFGGAPKDAVEAFGAALRGETEPARKYGVMINEAAIKAQALSMGLVQATADVDKVKAAQLTATTAQIAYTKAVKEHGADSEQAATAMTKLELAQSKLADATAGTVPELTAQQKTLASQKLIMDQTAIAAGNFADTSDSAANKQKMMTAQVQEAQTALGTALLPVVSALLPLITKLAKLFADNAHWLVPLAAGVLAVVAAVKLWTIAQAALNIVMDMNPWVLAIMAVIAAIVLVVKYWDEIKAAVEAAMGFVMDAVSTVWNWIKDNWPLLLGILTGPFGLAVVLILKYKDDIWNAIQFLWNWIKDNWPKLAAILAGPFGIAVYLIISHFDEIVSFVSGIPGQIADIFSGLADRVIGAAGDFYNVGVQMMQHLLDGITSMIGRILDKVGNVAGKVADALNPFGSPRTVAFYVGQNVMRDYVAGVESQLPSAARSMARIGGRLAPALAGGPVTQSSTYHVTVNVPVGAQPAQVGAATVDAIRAYERLNGKSWRTS